MSVCTSSFTSPESSVYTNAAGFNSKLFHVISLKEGTSSLYSTAAFVFYFFILLLAMCTHSLLAAGREDDSPPIVITPTVARLALGEDFLSRKRKGVCWLCLWISHRRGWFYCLSLKSDCNSSPSWLLAHQLIHFEKSIPLHVTGKIILVIL